MVHTTLVTWLFPRNVNVVLNGDKIEKEIVEISGRKISILDVKKTILKRSEKFMGIFTDEQYEKMSSTELMNEFIKINEFSQYDTNMLKNILLSNIKIAVYSSLNVLAWWRGSCWSWLYFDDFQWIIQSCNSLTWRYSRPASYSETSTLFNSTLSCNWPTTSIFVPQTYWHHWTVRRIINIKWINFNW